MACRRPSFRLMIMFLAVLAATGVFWPVHAAQELGCDADFGMWNPEYGWWLDKRKNNLPAERAATGQVK